MLLLNFILSVKKLVCKDSFLYSNYIKNGVYILGFIFSLGILGYRIFGMGSLDVGLLSFIISFVMSFIISNFVMDGFKFSENTYIRFVQRLLFYNIIFIMMMGLGFYIFYLLDLMSTIYNMGEEGILDKDENLGKDNDIVKVSVGKDVNSKEVYEFKVDKELVDSGIKNLGVVGKVAAEKIIPNMGAGAGAGAVAGASIKATAGMAPVFRVGAISAVTFVTDESGKVGLDVGEKISQNLDINSMIQNSPHANVNPDRIPSPDIMINSPLEITSPLQDLILYSFILDILILILLTIFFIIIFNRNIYSYNLNLINSMLNKYMPTKIRNLFNKYLKTGINYNNKLLLLSIISNSYSNSYFYPLALPPIGGRDQIGTVWGKGLKNIPLVQGPGLGRGRSYKKGQKRNIKFMNQNYSTNNNINENLKKSPPAPLTSSFGRLITFTILITMFWLFDGVSLLAYIKELFDGMSLLAYIKELKSILFYYIKYLLAIGIFVPIFLNGMTLYFLEKLEKTGEIPIPQNKILAYIFTSYINFINRTGKNNELFNYYKERCKNEIFFYNLIIILLIIMQFIHLYL